MRKDEDVALDETKEKPTITGIGVFSRGAGGQSPPLVGLYRHLVGKSNHESKHSN